ncbi:hypothetical protein CASFOL_013490 [Castilleja foliolosa]|uniref:Homeobox domain-containing protein n=1 Tax=Castilleja foliolosa TaxID=1961234 RepID=A0ABD3DK47_9LAMI
MALCFHTESNSSGSNNSGKQQQMDAGKYVRCTPEQVEALERVYDDCPKPTSLRRQQIIRECPILANIEPKQIKRTYLRFACCCLDFEGDMAKLGFEETRRPSKGEETETFVTVSVGKAFQIYNCARLNLVLVGFEETRRPSKGEETETFVTVSVGKAFQIYNCARLNLVLVD